MFFILIFDVVGGVLWSYWLKNVMLGFVLLINVVYIKIFGLLNVRFIIFLEFKGWLLWLDFYVFWRFVFVDWGGDWSWVVLGFRGIRMILCFLVWVSVNKVGIFLWVMGCLLVLLVSLVRVCVFLCCFCCWRFLNNCWVLKGWFVRFSLWSVLVREVVNEWGLGLKGVCFGVYVVMVCLVMLFLVMGVLGMVYELRRSSILDCVFLNRYWILFYFSLVVFLWVLLE